MESLYFLVPVALVFIAIAAKVLLWALNSGQYDNLDTEAHRILFEGEGKKRPQAAANPDSASNSAQASNPEPAATHSQQVSDRSKPE